MRTIDIHTGTPYSVHIGSGLLSALGAYAAGMEGAQTAAVISESNVWPLYGQRAADSLEQAGLRSCSFVFPAGESRKNGQTFLEILNFLAENRLTRTDLIIALGGGVVGDLAGFAAASYLRGIRLIQVPTTLLAAVDSSVGGKTAIDLPTGKNLAGVFYQPSSVLCDLDTLSTLPEEILRDGSAEVIKYGVLYDPELFFHLLESGLDFDREDTVARCVHWKGHVVARDEYDRGERQKLNLGHTVGHAIEKCSGYAVSHGQAVAAGMAIIARAASAKGICTAEVRDLILAVLQTFSLPTRTAFTAADLAEAALSDKKRTGGTVNLVLPGEIGRCILRPTRVEELEDWMEAGL